MKKKYLLIAALAAYLAGYGLALGRRAPAANMAYFLYSEDPGTDDALRAFFLPAYRLHRAACAALGRPFVRHNADRPRPAAAP